MNLRSTISITLILFVAVSGCGGGNGGGGSNLVTTTTNSTNILAGLWEVHTVSLVGSNFTPVTVPSGDAYFHLINVDASGVTATFYSKRGAQNCLSTSLTERLVATSQNEYRDVDGNIVTFIASGNSLEATTSSSGIASKLTSSRVVGLSVVDLSVCGEGRVRSSEINSTFIGDTLIFFR